MSRPDTNKRNNRVVWKNRLSNNKYQHRDIFRTVFETFFIFYLPIYVKQIRAFFV
jgi:hypothetical protein